VGVAVCVFFFFGVSGGDDVVLGALVLVLVLVVLEPVGRRFGGDQVDRLDATEKKRKHWTS
jgi:hypothetical protein